MRKMLAALAAFALAAVALPAMAGPGPDGVTSDNVEHIKYVPFEVGTATGARVIGKFMYVTAWKEFSIYDVSDPENPALLSTTPFVKDSASQGDGFRFENEDVATNGNILVFSESLPRSIIYVYNIEDKTNPTLLSKLDGAGSHTVSCLYDCDYLYGSTGNIIDLRDPAKPKVVGNWLKGMPASGTHDETEVRPGLVLTSSNPIMLVDTTDPLKPKLVALGQSDQITGGVHSNHWPNNGTDRWALISSESNAHPRCDNQAGAFMTWDTKGWKKTHTLQLTDAFRVESGTEVDGNPPVNGLGCSAHWFQPHPTFHNGGLVASGFYEHGTRFLRVDSNGKITQEGYFTPFAGSTSAAYWLTDRIVYAVDYSRGIDILKYNGKF